MAEGDTLRQTDYGFEWGPLAVTRAAHIPGRGRVVIIEPSDEAKAQRRTWRSIHIYWSDGGRSCHVSSRKVKRVRYPKSHPLAGEEGHRVVEMPFSEWIP